MEPLNKSKQNFLKFAGSWNFISNESSEDMEKLIKKLRRGSSLKIQNY